MALRVVRPGLSALDTYTGQAEKGSSPGPWRPRTPAGCLWGVLGCRRQSWASAASPAFVCLLFCLEHSKTTSWIL